MIIIYSNRAEDIDELMNDDEYIQDIKELLFNEYGKSDGWSSPEDATEEDISEYFMGIDDANWNEVDSYMDKMFDSPMIWYDTKNNMHEPIYIMTREADEVWNKMLKDHDEVCFSDDNGRFIMELDGHHYEGRILTPEGEARYYAWEQDSVRPQDSKEDVLKRLFNRHEYSKRPYFARTYLE